MKLKHAAALGAALLSAGPAFATNRQLDVVVINGQQTFPPFQDADIVGIFWDARCAEVEYTLNNIPANPGTANEIAPATLRTLVQNELDEWNANRASYIKMDITRIADLGARPRQGLDFINEVTWFTAPNFTALASSPSTSLTADTTFVAGQDLNGDGDPDVFDPEVVGENKCMDVDGDGDIEFPAGDYKAGTILDNDVQFSRTVVWETSPTNTGAADIAAVALHEFGHSHGLNHASNNQISDTDGGGSTMFPFIDTTDAGEEANAATLHEDDLANSAFIYQEGTATSGPAAVRGGDRPFHSEYDVITGMVARGGIPYVGANISAVQSTTQRVVAETYSGQARVFRNPATGGLSVSAPESAVDGDYAIPVPKNRVYGLRLQAPDGDPVPSTSVSIAAQIGAIIDQILGLPTPPEESRNVVDDAFEIFPGLSVPIFSNSKNASGDFEINNETFLRNAGPLNFVGSGLIGGGAQDVTVAERFLNADVLARLAAGQTPVSGNFRTGTLDSSLVPSFAEARIALGRVNLDNTVTIVETLRTETNVTGQDGDSTPVYFNAPQLLAQELQTKLSADATLDVFLILKANNLPPGPSGFPPVFVGLDGDTVVRPTSFFSINGGPLALFATFGQNPARNWAIEMRFSPPAP